LLLLLAVRPTAGAAFHDMPPKQHPRLIGYARVSTNGQELQLQLDALLKAACAKKDIFTDKVSGAKTARPGLDKCLGQLKAGDTLVVSRLDRLGPSVRVDSRENLTQGKQSFPVVDSQSALPSLSGSKHR
jgi:predicted site-specific integrase-resolvase